LAHAIAASPPPAKRRRGGHLPVLAVDEAHDRRCPLLSESGRCRVYSARPFGCRTFFCERAERAKVPRGALQSLGRRIADLSARAFPRDPGPRALGRALAALRPA